MAANALSMATVSEALKYRFNPAKLRLQGYKKFPLLGWLAKDESWDGDSMLHQIYYNAGRSKAPTIAGAQDNQTSQRVLRMTIDRVRNYGVASIEREFLLASRSAGAAMLNGKMAMIEGVQYGLQTDTARDLYRDGTGTLGRVFTVSAGATSTITLLDPEDIVHFEVGARVGFSTTASGAVKDGDYFQILSINRSAGSFIVDGNTGTGTAVAPNDFIFERGDAADTGALKKLIGLSGWVPLTAPTTGDNFYGADRSVDVTRCAGQRYDAAGTGASPLEVIIDAGTVMSREGCSPEVFFCNPVQRAIMAKELHGKTDYVDVKSSDARVFYKGLVVETGAGDVPVIADPTCPVDRGWFLRKDALKLRSLKQVPHLVDEDGLTLLRGASTDDFEIRFAQYANLVVDTPSEIMQVRFA